MKLKQIRPTKGDKVYVEYTNGKMNAKGIATVLQKDHFVMDAKPLTMWQGCVRNPTGIITMPTSSIKLRIIG